MAEQTLITWGDVGKRGAYEEHLHTEIEACIEPIKALALLAATNTEDVVKEVSLLLDVLTERAEIRLYGFSSAIRNNLGRVRVYKDGSSAGQIIGGDFTPLEKVRQQKADLGKQDAVYEEELRGAKARIGPD